MSTSTLQFPLNTQVLFGGKQTNYSNNYSIDEIDNKTPDISPFTAYSAQIAMHDSYKFEEERLKTFERWPLDFIDKRVLAQTGMYYTGDGDKVKCHFCDVEIGRWEATDHPVDEHMKWSPNCPLLRRRTVNNIPLNMDALDRVLPPVSYDVCGSASDPTETRPTAYAEDPISAPSTPGRPSYYQMEYPAYAVEGARFRSFADWPRTMKQKPKELAEAGFFYTGNGDRVNCFSCGGGLKDWDENDDPWEQHALWLKKCRYLKLIKGQEYIDAVIAKHKLAAEKFEEASLTQTFTSTQPQQQTTATMTNNNTQFSELQRESIFERCETNVDNKKPTSTVTSPSSSSSSSETTAAATATAAATSTINNRTDVQRSNSNSSTEKANIPEEKLCKICYAAEYNTTFLPCGHVVACARCASSVNRCPMCRKPFVDVMRVYFS